MADTVAIRDYGGSSVTVSTDELTIDTVAQHVQRVKIGLGANNAWDMDLDSGQQTMANSIPVAIASNQDFIFAEDAIHSSGDKGIMALAVRQNTQVDFAADGDYVPLSVADSGGVRTEEVGGALTSLQLIDNAIYTEGATDATIEGIPILWEDTSDTLRAVSAAKPLPVQPLLSASTIATGQVAPTGTAGTLVAARSTRTRLVIYNTGSCSIWVGPATVATSNGLLVPAGTSLVMYHTALIQAITGGNTGAVGYLEEYN